MREYERFGYGNFFTGSGPGKPKLGRYRAGKKRKGRNTMSNNIIEGSRQRRILLERHTVIGSGR